jgi:hypothetical protein
VPSMRRVLLVSACVLGLLATGPQVSAVVPDPGSTVDGALGRVGERRITYAGRIADQPDLAAAGFGASGHWFAQQGAPAPVSGAPTGDNARDALPDWVAALNHTEHPGDPGCTEPGALDRGCLPTYLFRTFSQDGPARSAGGQPGWPQLRLPDGECGVAGAIVDPQTFAGGQPNNNNTVNRIQLQEGVPSTFFVGVVTDTTAGQHDPGRLEVRGNVGLLDHREEVVDSQVEPETAPGAADLVANGVPDVHVFRVDGFRPGDYLKLRLRGMTSPASFTGLLFDESFDATDRPIPPRGRPAIGEPGGKCFTR